MTENDIIKICEKYNIKNYKINEDMSIDVNGDVDLTYKNLTELPLIFGKVTGYFRCSNNDLTSLKGCPKYVGGTFACGFNQLTNLKYCSKYVGESFRCPRNLLTSLDDLPVDFHITSLFICVNNKITEPREYSKLFFGYLGDSIISEYDTLDEFIKTYKNPPKKDLPKILSQLRKIPL